MDRRAPAPLKLACLPGRGKLGWAQHQPMPLAGIAARVLYAMDSNKLYETLGDELITQVITIFYERAFADPIIGHFFFNRDRQHLTSQQIDFSRGLLGGPMRYRGKPLLHAHQPLAIRPAHFDRRQVLMRQVLAHCGVAEDAAQQWLAKEAALRPLIVSEQLCNARS